MLKEISNFLYYIYALLFCILISTKNLIKLVEIATFCKMNSSDISAVVTRYSSPAAPGAGDDPEPAGGRPERRHVRRPGGSQCRDLRQEEEQHLLLPVQPPDQEWDVR